MRASSSLPEPTSGRRPQQPVSPGRFLVALAAWVIGLFALMRLAWVQQHFLLPFASLQQQVANQITGARTGTVAVDLSCTGADAIALCLGVIFAFPAPWRERLRGGALGLLLIVVLNTLRIGSLSLVADRPALLNVLHIYAWPAVLTIAVVAYVAVYTTRAGLPPTAAQPDPKVARLPMPLRRFLILATMFTVTYFALAPWLYESRVLQAVAIAAAATAGMIMSTLGASVAVSGNFLQTTHGAFVVTQECIATPLIPVYAAAALSVPLASSRRVLALLLAPLVFFGLGIARLLVLAAPRALIPSHAIAIHGFSQMLLAPALVVAVVLWLRPEGLPRRESDGKSDAATFSWGLNARQASMAIGAGAVAGLVVGGVWGYVIVRLVPAMQSLLGHAGHGYSDAQGALLMLPAYQVGLLIALWVAIGRFSTWRRFAFGLGVLAWSQIALFTALGELFHHIGFDPHVSLIRAWAVGAPVIIAFLIDRPFRYPAAITPPATTVHEQAPA